MVFIPRLVYCMKYAGWNIVFLGPFFAQKDFAISVGLILPILKRVFYKVVIIIYYTIKTKTDLNEKKSDFGRKRNNGIEPLRNWMKSLVSPRWKNCFVQWFLGNKVIDRKNWNEPLLASPKTGFEFVRSYDNFEI